MHLTEDKDKPVSLEGKGLCSTFGNPIGEQILPSGH